MERDTGGIVDGWAIAKLKAERIGEEECKIKFHGFCLGMGEVENRYPLIDWSAYREKVLAIHSKIWHLESAIRQGKLDNDLLEVGRRAIEIRDLNRERIVVKNEINALVGDGFQDMKRDHLSE